MTLHALEATATRAAIALLRRSLLDVYLPHDDALEPFQRDVRRVLELLDRLDSALLRLDIAVDSRSGPLPF